MVTANVPVFYDPLLSPGRGQTDPAVHERQRKPVLEQHPADRGDLRHDEHDAGEAGDHADGHAHRDDGDDADEHAQDQQPGAVAGVPSGRAWPLLARVPSARVRWALTITDRRQERTASSGRRRRDGS